MVQEYNCGMIRTVLYCVYELDVAIVRIRPTAGTDDLQQLTTTGTSRVNSWIVYGKIGCGFLLSFRC